MTAINRLKGITFDAISSGLGAKNTLTAIAVGSLLFLTSCGQPVEKVVDKETPRVEPSGERRGASDAAMEEARRAIAQSNDITGVKKTSAIQGARFSFVSYRFKK